MTKIKLILYVVLTFLSNLKIVNLGGRTTTKIKFVV
jgi:hypothetical protein